MERVTLHSGAKVWLFSASSVPLIPEIARLASSSPIEKYLPLPLVSWKLLDTALWRWIALLLLIAILVGLSTLISRLAVLWMVAGPETLRAPSRARYGFLYWWDPCGCCWWPPDSARDWSGSAPRRC